MKAPHAFNAVIAVAVALFAESLRVMGLQQIADGLRRVGWGFVALLAISWGPGWRRSAAPSSASA